VTYLTDWTNLGILPLQDHDRDAEVGLRNQLVGARIVQRADPQKNGSGRGALPTLGVEEGKGTIGDVHPWIYLQTKSRSDRATGSWSQIFGCVVDSAASGPVTGAGGDDSAKAFPVWTRDYEADKRYAGIRSQDLGFGLPPIVRGQVVAVVGGTDERQQQSVMLHADPRIIAPWTAGPYEAGTLVCDLQPEREICMDGSATPGVGGRHAGIQTFLKVVPLQPGGGGVMATTGNAIAWNCFKTPNGVTSHGLMLFGGASTGMRGPSTPSGRRDVVPGSDSPTTEGGSAGEDNPQQRTKLLRDYGRFSPRRLGAAAYACISVTGGGPLTAGHADNDEHKIGMDRDGNAINAAHISTQALFYDGPERDGPLLFEGVYPPVNPMPLRSRVHLTWDSGTNHGFVGGTRRGVWRWWCEVPVVVPGTPQTRVPTTPGGGPSTPGPGGPTTPGPGGPSAPIPGGPSPPGEGDPPVTGPVTPGGPSGPSAPTPEPWRNPARNSTPPSRGPTPLFEGESELVSPLEPEDPPVDPEAPGGRSVGRIGTVSPESKSLFSIHHPMMESFSSAAFRPQLWVPGLPHFERSPDYPASMFEEDEENRPHVLSIKSWAAQSDNDFDYRRVPTCSRVRGGYADGGVLLSPPEFEFEDYVNIGSTRSTTPPRVVASFAAADGVAFAWGAPVLDGGLSAGSFRMSRQWTGNRDLVLEALDSSRVPTELMRASIAPGERRVSFAGTQAVRLPSGLDSERPAPSGGDLRVNVELVNPYVEFYDLTNGEWRELISALPGAVDGSVVSRTGGQWVAIPPDTNGKVLTLVSGQPDWASPPSGTLPSGSAGDILYHDGADWVLLSPGADGEVLTLVSGVPKWDAPTGGGGPAFPVGSVFISVVSTNPATLLGYGTWAAIATGRMLIGVDSGDADFDAPEETGGSKTHTLTVGQLPSHTHAVTDPGHTHTLPAFNHATGNASNKVEVTNSATANSASTGSATTGITVGNTGSGDPVNHMPPFFAVYMWKRTA
jgi:hypothetical protein